MNVTVTCSCGNQFQAAPSHETACPHCGRIVVTDASLPDPDDIKLQELHRIPEVIPAFEVDDGTGFAIDAADGRAGLHHGGGIYSTVAIIPLDTVARCIAYGAAGQFALASQGEDVLIVDMNHYKVIAAYEGHEDRIASVALAPSAIALTGDDGGEMQLWDLATCTRKKRLRPHKDAINVVALSPDARLGLSGGVDCYVRLWDLASGRRRELEDADWEVYDQDITDVAFSRDGAQILAGGSDGRVSMWDTETGRRIHRYTGLELPIARVCLSDEGVEVIGITEPVGYRGTSYLTIARWDAKSGELLDEINASIRSIPCCVAPDRGGRRVIIGGGEDQPWLAIASLQNGRCLYEFEHLRGTSLSLAVSPHNNRILAALDTRRLQVFGMETA